jgi:hypothetical protein
MHLLDSRTFVPAFRRANGPHQRSDVFVHAMAAKGLTIERHEGVVLAYVNHGRWIADCHRCGSGLAITLNSSDGYCFECGAVHLHVAWPDKWEQIEGLLLYRPVMSTRNWYPNESVSALKAENVSHGL